jgi:hypothetical protein
MKKRIIYGEINSKSVYWLITEDDVNNQTIIRKLIVDTESLPLTGSLKRAYGKKKKERINGSKAEYETKIFIKTKDGKQLALCDKVLQEFT